MNQRPWAGKAKRIPPFASFYLQTLIGQNDNGFSCERSALAGRHKRHPEIVKVFGQEIPAAFQERDRKKERSSWNQGA
jgi:hypothetical protein